MDRGHSDGTQDSIPDSERRGIIRALADKALTHNAGSVFSTRKMRELIGLDLDRKPGSDRVGQAYLDGNISRRQFLKYLGIGTAAGGIGFITLDDLIDRASITGLQTAEDCGYRTVTVESSSQRKRLVVGDGQVLENVLFELNASTTDQNSPPLIAASGDDWTIRNIGVKGKIGRNRFMIAQGNDITIDFVYFGDGSLDNGGGWCYVNNRNGPRGPLDIKNVYIGHTAGTGIYGSATAEQYKSGVVNIRNSYFNSCNVAQFKLGSPFGTCEVENVTIRTDEWTPKIHGVVARRALWVLDNKDPSRNRVRLTDCDIQGSIVSECGGVLELDNTRWDGPFQTSADNDVHGCYPAKPGKLIGSSAGSPDLRVPNGIPCTPEHAACGPPR